MKKLIFLSFLVLMACSSKEKKSSCPTVADEPISACRAKEQCNYATRGSSVGVGTNFGIAPGFGFGVSRALSSSDYADCVDRSLKEQEEAKKKVVE